LLQLSTEEELFSFEVIAVSEGRVSSLSCVQRLLDGEVKRQTEAVKCAECIQHMVASVAVITLTCSPCWYSVDVM